MGAMPTNGVDPQTQVGASQNAAAAKDAGNSVTPNMAAIFPTGYPMMPMLPMMGAMATGLPGAAGVPMQLPMSVGVPTQQVAQSAFQDVSGGSNVSATSGNGSVPHSPTSGLSFC